MAVEQTVKYFGGQNSNLYLPYYMEVEGDGSAVTISTPGFVIQHIVGIIPVNGGQVSGLTFADGVVTATVSGKVHFSFIGVTKNQ